MDSRVGTHFFVGNIYKVVSIRGNEWGIDYCLAHGLEGKYTLMRSVIDSEGYEFPIRLMVIKGKYMKQDERTRNKSGYVFQYYRPGEVVYHFTNMVVGINLQLQTIPSKNSSRYNTSFLTLSMRS